MGGWRTRIIIMVVIAIGSVVSYFGESSVNPVTGEKQRVSLSPAEEIALGRESAPHMAREFGGLDPDPERQALVRQIGRRLAGQTVARDSAYPFGFHLLADRNTVNAFALPGGQIFITRALFDRLQTHDQIAGVLGHEVGHVIGRHSAQRLAKEQLTQGLTGAVAVGAGSYEALQLARVVGSFVNMKYGRSDETNADRLGLCLMREAGYDPRALVAVMHVLESASGGSSRPEFASTHPHPEHRIEAINANLAAVEQVCDFTVAGPDRRLHQIETAVAGIRG